MVCMAIIHFNMNCESMDQTLDHCIQAQWMLIFKAIESHGTISWTRILHQRMLLTNGSIETLCLEKRETVRSNNSILRHVDFHQKRARKRNL